MKFPFLVFQSLNYFFRFRRLFTVRTTLVWRELFHEQLTSVPEQYLQPTMPNKATHIPYGLTDPTKRTIRNPGIKDEAELKNSGIEIGGEPPICPYAREGRWRFVLRLPIPVDRSTVSKLMNL